MAAVALVILAVVLVVAIGVWTSRRHAIERERRRVDALRGLAERLDGMTALQGSRAAPSEPLSRRPAPLTGVALGGRAALVDATTEAVRRARADGARLAVAVVEAADGRADELGGDVAAVVGLTAYAVGPRSIAVVLPGASRAEALGMLARIQAACGATGQAAELDRDEEAVELLARLFTRESFPAED